MLELVNIKDMPRKLKIILLQELGYDSDGTFVLKDREQYLDTYTEDPIKIDNMFVFPGSTIILDNNSLSIASFLEDHGDVI